MAVVLDLLNKDHRPRHPEKAHRPDQPVQQRKPDWIRVKAPTHPVYHETRALMREQKLVTVCEEAACPAPSTPMSPRTWRSPWRSSASSTW